MSLDTLIKLSKAIIDVRFALRRMDLPLFLRDLLEQQVSLLSSHIAYEEQKLRELLAASTDAAVQGQCTSSSLT